MKTVLAILLLGLCAALVNSETMRALSPCVFKGAIDFICKDGNCATSPVLRCGQHFENQGLCIAFLSADFCGKELHDKPSLCAQICQIVVDSPCLNDDFGHASVGDCVGGIKADEDHKCHSACAQLNGHVRSTL